MKKAETILRIFLDETGDNGDAKGSSELIGLSIVLWDSRKDISKELTKLNTKLNNIGFCDMIHTNELLSRKGKYKMMSTNERKSIFNYLFYFYKNSDIKSKSFFVKKKELDNKDTLYKNISKIIKQFVLEYYNYFSQFSKVILYYDNGQKPLGKILDECLAELNHYEHIIHFDKTKERLFQVADMLTFIDKYRYKSSNKVYLSTKEKKFFTDEELKLIIKTLKKKEFK